jgi:hypothetical protein
MWPSLPECTSGEDKDPLTVTALWPQGSVFLSTHLAPHRFLTKQVSLTWENEGGGHFHCWPGSLRACPVHLISQGGMALCPAGPSWSQTHQPSRLMCVGVYLAPPPTVFKGLWSTLHRDAHQPHLSGKRRLSWTQFPSRLTGLCAGGSHLQPVSGLEETLLALQGWAKMPGTAVLPCQELVDLGGHYPL